MRSLPTSPSSRPSAAAFGPLPVSALLGRRLIGPVLGAIFLMTLASLLIPARADARLRVIGRWTGPNHEVVVRAGSGPDRHIRVPVACRDYKITPQDRKIAKRLARKTPYQKRVFLELRQAGFGWLEIGRILSIPPRLTTVAVQSVLHDQHGRNDDHGHRRGGR